jgi:hypothetical protein
MILPSVEACNESAGTCTMDGEFELAVSAVLHRFRVDQGIAMHPIFCPRAPSRRINGLALMMSTNYHEEESMISNRGCRRWNYGPVHISAPKFVCVGMFSTYLCELSIS